MIFFTCQHKKKHFAWFSVVRKWNEEQKNWFVVGVKNDRARWIIAWSLVCVYCVGNDDFRKIKVVFPFDLLRISIKKIHSLSQAKCWAEIMTLSNPITNKAAFDRVDKCPICKCKWKRKFLIAIWAMVTFVWGFFQFITEFRVTQFCTSAFMNSIRFIGPNYNVNDWHRVFALLMIRVREHSLYN